MDNALLGLCITLHTVDLAFLCVHAARLSACLFPCRTARFCYAAANGGQITMPLPLAAKLVKEWTGEDLQLSEDNIGQLLVPQFSSESERRASIRDAYLSEAVGSSKRESSDSEPSAMLPKLREGELAAQQHLDQMHHLLRSLFAGNRVRQVADGCMLHAISVWALECLDDRHCIPDCTQLCMMILEVHSHGQDSQPQCCCCPHPHHLDPVIAYPKLCRMRRQRKQPAVFKSG